MGGRGGGIDIKRGRGEGVGTDIKGDEYYIVIVLISIPVIFYYH